MAKDTLDKKDRKILEVLKDYPEGIRKQTILKLTGFKGRTCYNHLEKLKELKILQNIQPIWKIWHNSGTPEFLAHLQESDNKNTEGHRIWWILPLIRKPSWWNSRKDRLMNLKGWAFTREITANNNIYFQIENDLLYIQTFKNSIYFMSKQKYYGETDFEVFDKAKNDVLNAIKYLEERFRFKFLIENEFHLTLVDNHFVTMNETLAEHYYKEGKKFRIETEEGYSLWIDLSDPKGLESNNIETKRRYLNVVKDYAENPLIPLPSQIAKFQAENGLGLKKTIGVVNDLITLQKGLPIVLNQMGQQLESYRRENISHLALIKEYRKENVLWRKKKVKEIREELKFGVQSKLGEWL